jgi:hypothetical protein
MENDEYLDADLESREEKILKKLKEAEDDESCLANQVEAGATKNIDLDDFIERREPGSICNWEPRSYSTLESLKHPTESMEHIAKNPKGWMKGGLNTLNDRLEGKEAHASGKILAEVDSAEEAFEEYGVPAEGHFGLEVEIEAKDAKDADDRVRKALHDMKFEADGRNGYAYGGEQFWRNSEDGKQQEHLRYYGIVKEDSEHYRAIFIAEQESD